MSGGGGAQTSADTPPGTLPDADQPVKPEPLEARQLLGQRLVGGALMFVLLSVTAQLWGIDGAFRILFTAYTVWAGYWLWALFVRRPPA